jgi:hypothetical protein
VTGPEGAFHITDLEDVEADRRASLNAIKNAER